MQGPAAAFALKSGEIAPGPDDHALQEKRREKGNLASLSLFGVPGT